MKRAFYRWTIAGAVILCGQAHAAAPQPSSPAAGAFLTRVLAIAEHNNLKDVDFSKQQFGAALVSDSDGKKDLHDASTLDLTGGGPSNEPIEGFEYYYSLTDIKSALTFWRKDDPLFMGELGFMGLDRLGCITGQDVSVVFRADQNVGLVQGKTFHVSQGANEVTEITVDGPVEGDQDGCVKGLTIREHMMTEYVPSGSYESAGSR